MLNCNWKQLHCSKKRKQSNCITTVFIVFSQKSSVLCTLVVQSVSWMFFNIFTLFTGMNGTVTPIWHHFPLSFVLWTPAVTFVFIPGAVLGSVLTNHRNFGDCDAWFSKMSPFYSRFLKHTEQLITIPHQLFLKQRCQKQNKKDKSSTNLPIWWSYSFFLKYFNQYPHTFV